MLNLLADVNVYLRAVLLMSAAPSMPLMKLALQAYSVQA